MIPNAIIENEVTDTLFFHLVMSNGKRVKGNCQNIFNINIYK